MNRDAMSGNPRFPATDAFRTLNPLIQRHHRFEIDCKKWDGFGLKPLFF